MPPEAPPPPPSAPSFNPDRTLPLIAEPIRRRVLGALARDGAAAGSTIARSIGADADVVRKHLAALCAGGVVVASRALSPDKRKLLYALAPGLQPQMQEGRLVLDFGFCLLRF